MTNIIDIKVFLYSLKHVDIIDFVPTEKNRQTRLKIGLTAYEQEQMIRTLTFHDYHSGPLKDNDSLRQGNVWIFKVKYEGHKIYIKLKEVFVVNMISVVKCLSFHIDNM